MVSAASTAPHRVRPAELARLLGVSRQSVHELIGRAVIPRDADGRVDVEIAKLAIANRVHPSGKTAAALSAAPGHAAPVAAVAASGAPGTAAAPAANDDAAATSYHVAKTLREAAEARIAQLKLAELRGDLIRVDAVRAEWARILAGLREAFLQMPARVVPLLVSAADAQAMDELLRDEISLVLRTVSQGEAV